MAVATRVLDLSRGVDPEVLFVVQVSTRRSDAKFLGWDFGKNNIPQLPH